MTLEKVPPTDSFFPYFRPLSSYSESRIEIDNSHRPHNSVIDVAEREYRARFQPNYRDEVKVGITVDPPAPRSSFTKSIHIDETTVDAPRHTPVYKESFRASESTIDPPAPRSTFHKSDVQLSEETVDAPRYEPSTVKKSKMGYYDEDGEFQFQLILEAMHV